jgi:PAS domain S-box-containing protein
MNQFAYANSDASLRNYAEFVRNVPTALYRVTIEGQIVFCNDPFARLFGFESIHDAIGFPVINLYRNKEDRGIFIQTILQSGCINEIPLALKRLDGYPIWASVTTKAILDDDGVVVFLDGSLRDVTGEIEDARPISDVFDAHLADNQAALTLDIQGEIIEANVLAADILMHGANRLSGMSFAEFLIAEDKQLFFIFLADIVKVGREEIIFKLRPVDDRSLYVKMHALLVRNEGRVQKISCIIDDVTHRIHQLKAKYSHQKFEGVLEMAGGVAHRFNQPLTIVTNIISEVLSKLDPEDECYAKIVRADDQIRRMSDITHKIGNIKKYKAVDYVAGVRIVDIDKAS